MTTKDFIKQQISKLLADEKRLLDEYSSVFEITPLNSHYAERLRDMADLLSSSTDALFLKSNDLCQVFHTEDELNKAKSEQELDEFFERLETELKAG